MMIGKAIDNVHQYIKQHYIINNSDIDISTTEFYQDYIFWFENHVKGNKKISRIQIISCKLKELGIIAKQKR